MREIIVDKAKCTGCGACCSKCPQNAIDMIPDGDGFLYPSIHASLCIECGICDTVCPALHPHYKNSEHPECYAMWADDEIRQQSSSGGTFSLLAQYILDNDGVVVGAAYSKDFRSVSHILIDNGSDLSPLRGSKYVQSNIGDAYKKTREALVSGRKVLFSGTPCQIAGLYGFLGREYPQLYTVDLICHGVPTEKLLDKFLDEQIGKAGAGIRRLAFRDKQDGGWNHSTSIDFENGEHYRKKKKECAWLKAFLSGLMFRESCGQCQFAKLPRQGDISIGDFWDIHLYDRSLDDQKGTSLILVNSDKGKELVGFIRASSKMLVPASMDHAVKYNGNIIHSSRHNPNRKRFLHLIKTHSFETAVDLALNKKYDIGYVGWWYGKNYGSALTSYAMNRYLESIGKSVLMLDFPLMSDEKAPSQPLSNTREFAAHFYNMSERMTLNDHKGLNSKCDTFIVGSDQLWHYWSNADVGTYYFFLDFVDQWRKKISYSTSFGHENGYYPEEMRLKIGWLLSRFDALSVREKSAIDVLKRDFDVDSVQTADPVFLCGMRDWEKAIELSKVDNHGEYVLAYILNPTEEKKKSIQYISEKMNLPYYIILDGQGNQEILKKEMNDDNVLIDVRIEDWLKYFKNSSYIVTDSFHGFCFSIIFEKQMTVFPNKLRGLTRFESLADWVGIHRFAYGFKDVVYSNHLSETVDFTLVKKRMEPMIAFSREWLDSALSAKKLPRSVRELQLKKCLENEEIIRHMSEQISELQRKVEQLEHQPDKTREGMLRWFSRKAKGGLQCLKDNGLKYTAKRLYKKIKRKLAK